MLLQIGDRVVDPDTHHEFEITNEYGGRGVASLDVIAKHECVTSYGAIRAIDADDYDALNASRAFPWGYGIEVSASSGQIWVPDVKRKEDIENVGPLINTQTVRRLNNVKMKARYKHTKDGTRKLVGIDFIAVRNILGSREHPIPLALDYGKEFRQYIRREMRSREKQEREKKEQNLQHQQKRASIIQARPGRDPDRSASGMKQRAKKIPQKPVPVTTPKPLKQLKPKEEEKKEKTKEKKKK